MKILLKKFICIIMLLFIVVSNVQMVSYANNNIIGTYSGTTTTSEGYHPYCVFTINNIVGNKFRGSFSAANLDVQRFVS